jgi:hypothetical protein
MSIQSLAGRLERLEAEQQRDNPRHPVHMVNYWIEYGDNVPAKRAEAMAEFRRKNPDWQGPLNGRGGPTPVGLIELVGVAAEEGRPKHADWQPYLDALDAPDMPENAAIVAAYEAKHCHAWQSKTA